MITVRCISQAGSLAAIHLPTRRPVVAVLPRHHQRRVDVGSMLGDNGRYWRHIRRDKFVEYWGCENLNFRVFSELYGSWVGRVRVL